MSESQGELEWKENRGMTAVAPLLSYSSLPIDLNPPKNRSIKVLYDVGKDTKEQVKKEDHDLVYIRL